PRALGVGHVVHVGVHLDAAEEDGGALHGRVVGRAAGGRERLERELGVGDVGAAVVAVAPAAVVRVRFGDGLAGVGGVGHAAAALLPLEVLEEGDAVLDGRAGLGGVDAGEHREADGGVVG